MLERDWFELLDTSSSSKHSLQAVVGFAGECAQCSLRTKDLCWWDDNAVLGVRNISIGPGICLAFLSKIIY